MTYAELTVTGQRNGSAAWMLDFGADKAATTIAAVREHIEPAVAFLAAQGGGVMILPLETVG